MPVYVMTKEQVIKTTMEDLMRVGLLYSPAIDKFKRQLDSYEDASLIRMMVLAHEIKELHLASEATNQKSQVKRGRLMAKLTGQLRPAHVAKGYHLMEDEDYLYLYLPDDKAPPIVFNAYSTKMEDVINTICKLEGEDG